MIIRIGTKQEWLPDTTNQQDIKERRWNSTDHKKQYESQTRRLNQI